MVLDVDDALVLVGKGRAVVRERLRGGLGDGVEVADLTAVSGQGALEVGLGHEEEGEDEADAGEDGEHPIPGAPSQRFCHVGGGDDQTRIEEHLRGGEPLEGASALVQEVDVLITVSRFFPEH